MKFSVENQEITRIDSGKIVAGSENFVTAEFVLDEDWDELTLTAYFQNGNVRKAVFNVDDSTPFIVPHEVLKPGNLYIYLEGYDSNVRVTSAKMSHPVTVAKSGKIHGATVPETPTPSVYDQILSAYSLAQESVDSLIQSAEDGNLDGKDLEFCWDGTRLGVKKEDDEEFTYRDVKGERGNPGVFVGSGNMPADCFVQVDPDGACDFDEYAQMILQSADGKDLPFDPASTTLEATDVSSAIEELDAKIEEHHRLVIDSWEKLQQVVRSGEAAKYVQIGDQFTCSHERYGELVWEVVGIDHDQPSDEEYTHSVTLKLHEPVEIKGYSAPMAFYYVMDNLAPGTYHFSLSGDGRTFCFTSGVTVPADSYLVLSWDGGDDYTFANIFAFTANDVIDPIATFTFSEGTSGSALPFSVNSFNCSIYGKNGWQSSVVRFFLNSSSPTFRYSGDSPFDITPTEYFFSSGFLCGMDEDFLSCVGYVSKTTVENGYAGAESERFFLPSQSEVGGSDSGEGEAYPPYASADGNSACEDRIAYAYECSWDWWLRTSSSDETKQKTVGYSGEICDKTVNSVAAIVPFCCIV